jgi:hypothetical protein
MSVTNDTTRAIINFLTYSGNFAWRNNSQGTFDPATKRFRGIPVESRGAGDILCCLKGGWLLEVEIKRGSDRMSEVQKKHRDRIIAAGGLYIAVSSYDDFRRYYDQVIGPMARLVPRVDGNSTTRDATLEE